MPKIAYQVLLSICLAGPCKLTGLLTLKMMICGRKWKSILLLIDF